MTIQNDLALIRQSAIDLLSTHWAMGMEMLVTATQLEKCMPSADSIAAFLAARFERIRGTDLSYVHATHLPVTAVCLRLAQQISPLLGKPALQLLMPTLNTERDPITLWSLEDYKLPDILLSDDDTRFIDIASAIDKISAYSLTENEKLRLIQHSTETQAIDDLNQEIQAFDTSGTIGAAIESLLIGRLQHAAVDGKRDGLEYIAGFDADIGLIQFNTFLDTLPPEQKDALFQCRVSPSSDDCFLDLWKRLVERDFNKPNELFEKGTRNLVRRYCAKDIRTDLNFLLQNNPELFRKNTPNGPLFLETLTNNKNIALSQLKIRLETSSVPVNASYGKAGKVKLTCQVLTDESITTLTTTEKATLQQTLRAFPPAVLDFTIRNIPETYRHAFFQLIGLDFIHEKYIHCGMTLAGQLGLLPKSERGNFLFSLNLTTLHAQFNTVYEWGQVVALLEEDDAKRWVASFTTTKLQEIIRSGLSIKNLFTRKLAPSDWPKVAPLFKTDTLNRALRELLTQEFQEVPAAIQLSLILFLGIERVFSLIPGADKRKQFLSLLSKDDQEQLWSKANFKSLFLTANTTSKKNLDTTVKQTLAAVDELQASTEKKQEFYKDTLCYYQEERRKQLSPHSLFSGKKTRAIDALQNAASQKSPTSALKSHKKQLERNNALGQIYRRMNW